MALSATAIMAVYGAGYLRTEPVARAMNRAVATAKQAARASSASSAGGTGSASSTAGAGSASAAAGAATAGATTGTAGGGSAPAKSSAGSGSNAPASSSAAGGTTGAAPQSTTTSSKYRNGTYTGTGWGRHGPITATVVIRGGRIVSANVSRCGTTYPCYYIDPLVGEVVARQSARTDYVGGATDSSLAYQQAVAQALAQASA